MKTVIVTGASSGIGKAIACRILAEGNRVIAVGRRRERLYELSESARGEQGQVMPVAGDVCDPETLSRALDAGAGADTAVLCAGVMKHAEIMRSLPSDWQELFDVNVTATMTWAQALLRAFDARGGGQIILISSTLARSVLATTSAYSASKAALHAFAQGLRLEGAAIGVRVSEIMPGFTDSELRRSVDDPRALERISAQAASLQPSDIADAVSFAMAAPVGVSIDEISISPAARPASRENGDLAT